METILVTGSAGFIGFHVVKKELESLFYGISFTMEIYLS